MHGAQAWAFGLLTVRVLTGVGIVVWLIGVVVHAYRAKGAAEATQVFQLLQGILLSVLAFLYTTQAVERAEASALAAKVEADAARSEGLDAGRDLRQLREESAAALDALDRLSNDPEIGKKVQRLLEDMQ